MNKLHTCLMGHQWEAPVDEPAPRCPHCQATVIFAPGPAPASDREQTVVVAAAEPVSGTAAVAAADEAILPAVSVPGYKLLGQLGRGGMGVVYKARDVRLNRLVALKMILAGAHASPSHLARFKAEAETVARLQHPNIVQIHDVGAARAEPAAVHPFMALEFCPGGSLAERLEGTPVPPRPAAELVETLARAMGYAHDAGILHRDLKPANILLASGGRQPLENADSGVTQRPPLADCIPKITDFGLAKLLQPDSAHPLPSADPTTAGAVMGTPSYMAPEQAGGNRQPVSPATDTYALGAILYELLTGRPPFKGTTPLETVLQVVRVEPVSPRRLQPTVPVDLETVCLKCLQKDPKKRYARAVELADDLRRWLNNEPIRARRIGPAGRLTRWCRRNPVLAAVSAGAALLVLLLSGLYAWGLHRQIGATRAALGNEQQARAELSEEHDRSEMALARSLYEQARAIRQSPAPGRQWRVLDLLRQAAALRRRVRGSAPSPGETADTKLPTPCDLRSEAVAALLAPDGRVLRRLNAIGPLGCALSSDGSRAVSRWLSEDERAGGVRLWDLGSGRLLKQFNDRLLLSGPFALSPDGRLLAVLRLDLSVGLLEMPAGTARGSLRLPALRGPHQVLLAFSPDATAGRKGHLAVAWSGQDSTDLAIWDLPAGALPRTRIRLAGKVQALAFAGTGTLVTTLDTQKIGTLDLGGGAPVEVDLPLPPAALPALGLATQRLACSPSATLAAVACAGSGGKGVLLLWDLVRRREVRRWQGGLAEAGFPLAFSPDGTLLAAGTADGSVRCYPLRAGGQTLSLERVHLDGVGLVGWDRQGHLLTSGNVVGALHVWELSYPAVRAVARTEAAEVRDFALSPDGRWLAVRADQPRAEIVLVRRPTLEVVRHIGLDNAARAGTLLFRPDGQQLALVGPAEALAWEVETGRQMLRRKPEDFRSERWLPGAFLADGRLLVASPRSQGGVRVWDLVSGRAIQDVGSGPILRASLAARGRSLLALPAPHGLLRRGPWTIAVWDVATGQKRTEVKVDQGAVGRKFFWARLSPDGRWLVWLDVHRTEQALAVPAETFVNVQEVGGSRAWRIPSGVLATSASFSPDGRLLALGYTDGLAQLWDVKGTELFHWSTPRRGVQALAFAGDTAVASSGVGGDVRIVDLLELRRRLAPLGLDW